MKKPQGKILVVDDEPDQTEFLGNFFRKRRFEVLTCAEGNEALRLVAKEKPDIVLLDLRLEGELNGKGVLTELRKHDKETKVIINTGSILLENEELKSFKELGISEFLTKPIQLEKLEEIVYTLINKKSATSKKKHPSTDSPKTSKDNSLRPMIHDLSNLLANMRTPCESFILDTEEGLNKDKTAKDNLTTALEILRKVVNSVDRASQVLERLSKINKKTS